MTNKTIIMTESQFNHIINNGNMPLLNEVYDTANKSKLISLNEVNARSLVNRHSQNGYAIISACRGKDEFGLSDSVAGTNKHNQINVQRTKELISDVQKHGFSYTLSYGGFIENKGTDKETNVYERSVVVYAEKRDGTANPEELFNFAIEECNKFNQDSVLIKMPNDVPKYYKKNGDIDMTFPNDIKFNDLSQIYFTDLHKNTERKMKQGSKPTRFSFTESYIAPKPQCYSEGHIRYMRGERFLQR